MNDAASGYRLQGLYRLILAFMVLWGHSITLFFPELSWAANLQLGNVAVASFFVLSGYLMTGAIHMWYEGRLLAFISNRYLRISPPLLVAGVVSIISFVLLLKLGFPLDHWEPIPKAWISSDNAIRTLLSPLFPVNQVLEKFFSLSPDNTYNFVRYSWAIFVEFFFYWFLFFYFLSRSILGVRFASVIFLLIVVTLSVIGIFYHHRDPGQQDFVNTVIARVPLITAMKWLPQFLLGVMLCEMERDRARSKLKKALLYFSAAGALVQLCLFARSDFMIVGVLYAITNVIGFSAILSGKQQLSIGKFILNRKLDNKLGSLSYPVYINHYAIGLLFFNVLAGIYFKVEEQPLVLRVLLFLLFNLLVIIISKALITLTDKITDSLRDRIRGHKL